MTDAAQTGVSAIVEQRQHLEDTVQRLRECLQHWQTWEAEYQGIKEEIQSLPVDASKEDLIDTGKHFGGDLVNESEVRELFGHDHKIRRSPMQIVGVICRRIDYVQHNVDTIQRQVAAAQRDLADLATPAAHHARQEKGLPFTEIFESLDDDGRVITGTTSRPVDSEKEIWQTLKKAGIQSQDLPHTDYPNLSGQRRDLHDRSPSSTPDHQAEPQYEAKSGHVAERVLGMDGKEAVKRPSILRKKSVSFAEGTKEDSKEQHVDAVTQTGVSRKPSGERFTDMASLAKGSFRPDQRVVELDEYDNAIGISNPVIPENESPEETAMRREILQYSMNEVGSIVAQLDLEEGVSSDGYSDDDDGDTDLDSASGGDEEDQYGLKMRSTMSDSYRHEMMDLERKLNAQMFQNVGPRHTDEHVDEALPETAATSLRDAPTEGTPPEKIVRFADEIKVAPSSPKTRESSSLKIPGDPPTAVQDKVLERHVDNSAPPVESKWVSCFKSQRSAAASADPAIVDTTSHPSKHDVNPSPSVMSDDVMERPMSNLSSAPDQPDDESDPMLLRKEVAADYYRQRNRLIQKQGGFVLNQAANGESAGDDAGPPKKASLFKSARLQSNR